MRQLFWKEWYELRMLPLASAACVALLVFAARSFNKVYDTRPLAVEDTLLPLSATWALFGLLAGAGLIAQEIGSGSLLFLSALPISRRRIWWVKAATALGVFLLAILSSALVWAILDAFLLQSAFFHAPMWHQSAGQWRAETGITLLILLGLFVIALAVSPFLDRPISAVVAAVLVSIGHFAALQALVFAYETHFTKAYFNGIPPSHDSMLPLNVLVALSVPLFAAISFWTFTRGETLRSAKRFRIGAVAGGIALALVGLVFFAGNVLLLW